MAVGAPLTQKPKGLPARETAVVFVHGMGSQRRHEDSAKLAERLDEFTQSSGMGLLRGLKPEIEPSEFIPAGYATALRGRFLDGGQFGDPEDEKRATRDGRTFKFYEAYWAPITADEVPKWTVVRWMFSRVPKPIIATRAPWRHRSRFRRSLLLETDEIDGDVRSRLYELYDEFEGHPSRRKYPDGNFEEFKHFLETSEPTRANEFLAAAERWKWKCRRTELQTQCVLLTLALAMLLGVTLILLGLVLAIQGTAGGGWGFPSLREAATFGWDHKGAVLAAVGGMMVVLPLAAFLQGYLGDVLTWTTYEETNARYRQRNQILEATRDVLKHVLAEEKNERVVVVAHSLGTAIAVDTIHHLANLATAYPSSPELRVRKVTHLVTYGSPIDKIQYLFEPTNGQHHRYNRVVEQLRGDIGTAPFASKGRQYVHWVNLWNQADIISGRLQSPCNRATPGLRVDNVAIRGSKSPMPGAAHTGYLRHSEVVQVLATVIFRRKSGQREGHLTFGPGNSRAWVKVLQVTVAFAIWGAAFLAGALVWKWGV